MSTGFALKVSNLVEIMLAGVGQRGAEDLKYHWFETIYGIIREQTWSWNWAIRRWLTTPPIVSTETYTWGAGLGFLQASGPMSFGINDTGRYIEIDSIPYRITKVLSATNQLWLDGNVHTTETVGVVITAYRANMALKTTSIFRVEVDGNKTTSTTKDFWKRFGGQRHIGWTEGNPCEYETDESFKIDRPLYAPYTNGAAIGGNIADGAYEYFWTAYDNETGRDSKPGPILSVTYSIGGAQQDFGYNQPAPSLNTKEGDTYRLRLWRTKVGPIGERSTAWLIGTKDPTDAADFLTDNVSDETLIANERYYDGSYVEIRWHNWPDDVYPVYVQHTNNYEGRPDPDDLISLGRNNILTELLPMGASTFIELANRGVKEQHAAIIKFRQQLSYLVKEDDNANDADPGIGELFITNGIPEDDSLLETYHDPTLTYTFKY